MSQFDFPPVDLSAVMKQAQAMQEKLQAGAGGGCGQDRRSFFRRRNGAGGRRRRDADSQHQD